MPYKIIEVVTHDGKYIVWDELFKTREAAEAHRRKYASSFSSYNTSKVVSIEELIEKEKERLR